MRAYEKTIPMFLLIHPFLGKVPGSASISQYRRHVKKTGNTFFWICITGGNENGYMNLKRLKDDVVIVSMR